MYSLLRQPRHQRLAGRTTQAVLLKGLVMYHDGVDEELVTVLHAATTHAPCLSQQVDRRVHKFKGLLPEIQGKQYL